MSNIVETINISKSYDEITAVADVSLNIKEGEFFSLLGPSGCGKTTILRMLGGFIEQDRGRIIIDGKDMQGIPPNRRNTSMVFQNLALFPHMNAGENIIYGLRKKRMPQDMIRKRLALMLEMVGLTGLERRRISELSGGQQQRVALARSLIIEPKILLLDEPLASLDKKLRISMQSELKEIQEKVGTTFLYVTHDQSEALTMSNTIAIMSEGRIIQTGSPDLIYNCPLSIFAADFIGAGNFIPVLSEIKNGEFHILDTRYGSSVRLKIDQKKECISGVPDTRLHFHKGMEIRPPVFFIRPEKIKISRECPPEANCYKGIILSNTFEGPDIRLDIDSADVGRITVEIKNDGRSLDFRRGSTVSFYWNHDDGMLLRY